MSVTLSSSSEDDCYGNAAGKLNDMKSNWKAVVSTNDYTSDPNISSDDTDGDRSPAASTKVKRKHKKSTRNMDRALDLDTSATSDVSVKSSNATGARVTRSSTRAERNEAGPDAADLAASGPARGSGARLRGSGGRGRPPRGRTARGKTSKGRRSRVRNSANSSNSAAVINIGPCSDSEESYQPLFSKSSTQSKEVIDLDSSGIDNSLNEKNTDIESENEELSVKVYWRSKEYHTFKIRKYQKISSIFEFFAKLEKVAADNLLMTLGDRVLRPVDTPASIGYTICNFIEGGVVSQSVSRIAEESAMKYDARSEELAVAADKNLVIKMRSKDMKNPLEVTIGKNQKLSIAMVKFSEEIEVPLSGLKFFFDGDPIDSNSTPKTLDLEGGECLDVHVAE